MSGERMGWLDRFIERHCIWLALLLILWVAVVYGAWVMYLMALLVGLVR